VKFIITWQSYQTGLQDIRSGNIQLSDQEDTYKAGGLVSDHGKYVLAVDNVLDLVLIAPNGRVLNSKDA
jgi:hypothetical protein